MEHSRKSTLKVTHKKFETLMLVHKKVLLMESEAYCIKVSS